MAKDWVALKSVPRSYAELRRGVAETLLTGQRRIEEAKVRTYWETGRLIHEHLLVHKDRAQYGGQVVPRLAEDLGISARVLYHCVQFARTFPILTARSQFTWAHYRALLQVEDQTERQRIEAEAAKNGWTSRQLEERIRPLNLSHVIHDGAAEDVPSGTSQPLSPKRGTAGIYKIVSGGERLSIDLGFTSYLDLTGEQAAGLKAGDFVRLDAKERFIRSDDAKASDLYTWKRRSE